METQEKKSLALTLIGHGVVLMMLFLGAAFVHKPKPEVMMLDFNPVGGPKAARNLPPAPSSGGEDAPEHPTSKPAPQARENPPPKPAPAKNEFPTKPKTPPKKAPPPKKQPPKPAVKKTPVKTTAKPTVVKSGKKVVRRSGKPSPSPARSESAADIRKRMSERLGKYDPNADVSEGGDGTGNASGTSNRFAAYLGGLEEEIQIAWEQPPSAEVGLKTEVGFLLEKSGHLTGIRIVKSSGNSEMDQSALLAVKSIGSYQPWPPDFTSALAKITVEFVCKPNQ